MRWWLVVVLAACGGGSAQQPSVDGGLDVDGSVAPPTTCTPHACGGGCGMCRYASTPLATSVAGDKAVTLLADGTVLHGAYVDATLVSDSGHQVAFVGGARAADGSLWALSYGDAARIGHLVAGAWTWTNLGEPFNSAAFAMRADGTPMVAFVDFTGIAVATGPDFATTQRIAATAGGDGIRNLALAVAPDGTPWLAYSDEMSQDLQVGSTTTPPTSVGASVGYDVPVDLVVTADGPHVFFRGDGFEEAHLDGGAWKLAKLAPLPGFGSPRGGLRAAIAANGDLAVAYVGDEHLYVASFAGGGWSVQTVESMCGEPVAAPAWVGDKLALATACTDLLVQTGERFPDDFAATCQQLAHATCTEACACGAKCPMQLGGRHQEAFPEGYCEDVMTDNFCGFAALDPAVATTCLAAVPSATCNADGDLELAEATCAYPW